MGLVFSASLLMSAASGVMHNVMSRTQPPPPAARPSQGIDAAAVTLSPAEAVGAFKDLRGDVQSVSVRPIGGEAWYQFIVKGEAIPRYVHARTGAVGEGEDELYAKEIASAALGGTPVRKTDYLTGFTMEYINIFRILPVYRFDADDGRGTRVYVSTMTGSVTRNTDDKKQWEADFFSNFHKLMFIRNKDLRDLTLTVTTAGIFAVGILGIALFFMTQPKKVKSKGGAAA
jgi:hypothetical protein